MFLFGADLNGGRENFEISNIPPLFGDAPSLPLPSDPLRSAHLQKKEQQQEKSLGTDPLPAAVTDIATARGAAGDASQGPGPVRDVSVEVA